MFGVSAFKLVKQQLLTSLGVQGTVVVDIGIAQGATGHSITADTDGCHWSHL